MAASSDLASNFEFPRMIADWVTYDSTRDKTNVSENIWVRGSKNMYKKLSGTIANRPGQKRLGVANPVASPISSKFVWNTSWGVTYILVVSNSNLYVVINNVWYSLLSGLTGTRYVFDKWWSTSENKSRVIFVHGTSEIQHWSGGFASLLSASSTAITLIGNSASLTAPVTTSGTGPFTSYLNSNVGTSFAGSVVFSTNPTNGQTMILNVNGTPITVTFVSTIGAVAGNVLIGATLANTLTNLVGLLSSPSTTSATQVAFSSPNQTLIGHLNSAVTNTITKNGTESWASVGFSSTSGEETVVINGTTYTYTGGSDTQTVYGVTPSAVGEAVNSTIIQSVFTKTNTPTAGFNNDYIKVIGNQAYVGSYTSQKTYISSQTDFSNYVVPTPRLAGDPDQIILDGTGRGIGVRQGNAYIGTGTIGWTIITFANQTVGTDLVNVTTRTVKPVAVGQGPYAHEFIDTVGDSLVYLAQDQQVRSFTDTNNLFTPAYPSFSQEIATELSEENFTGGYLNSIGEFVYICAPARGNTYIYQVRTSVNGNGTMVAERLWYSPFIWNLTGVDQIDGVVIGFSNANPQIYQLWDTGQWHDDSPSGEPLPYACVLALSYRGEQRRAGLWSFDKNYTEGYWTEGTNLKLQINYNYQGATRMAMAVVNSTTMPGYSFLGSGQPSSMGDESLGDEVLGDGQITTVDDQDALPKYKVINSVSVTNCFEWQPVFSTDQVDARWEILATATNAVVEAEQQATFIINKKRN